MTTTQITEDFIVSPQISVEQIQELADQGIRTIINNRPDAESSDQPSSKSIAEAAAAAGLSYVHIPVETKEFSQNNIDEFRTLLDQSPKPALAFCRTGRRSTILWSLVGLQSNSKQDVIGSLQKAGIEAEEIKPILDAFVPKVAAKQTTKTLDVIIVGGGAAGIATAASLLKRTPDLKITIIEPTAEHFYQPGWTLVGAGVFSAKQTQRSTKSTIPAGVTWIQDAVTAFDPDNNRVDLKDGGQLNYRYLVVAPGIKLDWDAIEGLSDTLGKNGVTSNYDFQTAPYTWELVKNLRQGRAVFTQPPMPIKCAGAPQKALYLSCHHWEQSGALKDIDVSFYNSGAVLFGVKDYVAALEAYIDRYQANLHFSHTLSAVDGSAKKAWFNTPEGDQPVEISFDMLHVSPPQTAPDFVRTSPLANDEGWIDVSSETLQHSSYENIFALGDACSAPNAKTAAAVRKQAPVVASNLTNLIAGRDMDSAYDGYGSCPLTVEKGKIVLAEFGYGGSLLPSVPSWINDGTKPTRAAWWLKTKLLPPIYFDMMLKGREWLAEPKTLTHKSAHKTSPKGANP